MRVVALCAAAAVMLFAYLKADAYVLDVEFRGPEWDRAERDYQDRENERAVDRVDGGSTDSKDRERANDWHRDHDV
jgi:hypothetical protein